MNDSILNLTKKDLDKLEERYGNLFFEAYKKRVLDELDRQEMVESLLAHEPRKPQPARRKTMQNTRERYGDLLDRYIG